jgi:hypothetical protein
MKMISEILSGVMQSMFGEPKYRRDVPAWMVGHYA